MSQLLMRLGGWRLREGLSIEDDEGHEALQGATVNLG